MSPVIAEPCGATRLAAVERQAQLTKPPGSLGRLEEIACDLASLQGEPYPSARPAAAILFAADHPVCAHGVSPYPSAVTAAMVKNFSVGGAAANVLCRKLSIPLQVVDVGVDMPYETLGQAAEHRRVGGILAGDLRAGQALPGRALELALDAGRASVDRLPRDTRVVILGEMGIGNTTVAAALTAALTQADADAVVGRGTGADDDMLLRKRSVVADAAKVAADLPAMEVMRRVGGREVASLMGAALRAAELGMVVLVDGYIVSAAMLCAVGHCPELRPYLLFGHRSREPGHLKALEALEARPLLDLDMALGEGSGALTAFHLIELACHLHRDMATFESASIPGAGGEL